MIIRWGITRKKRMGSRKGVEGEEGDGRSILPFLQLWKSQKQKN